MKKSDITKQSMTSLITISIFSIMVLGFAAHTPETNIQVEQNYNDVYQQTKSISVTFNNKTGNRIYLQLSGQQNVSFWLEPGKAKIELEKGIYQYSYYADGGYEKGGFKLKGSGITVNLLLNRNTLTIKSQINEDFFIRLNGPRTYYNLISKGNNKFDLVPGTYSYSFFADGETITGVVNLRKGDKSIVLKLVRSNLRIINKSGGNIYISIRGANNYSQTFGGGKTVISVIPGNYSYAYYFDGEYFSGIIKVKGNGTKLTVGELPKVSPSSSKNNDQGQSLGGCHPSYPSVCLAINKGDYDCKGGSGNGPNYIKGPIVVLQPDPFDLDRDNDGIGCE